MVTTASCPSKEELFRLNHGDLPGEQLESVCDHVEACEKCQLILGQLDDPPDEFAKQLAQITPEALENARVAIEAETLKETATGIWGRFSPVLESKDRKPTLTVPCQLGQYEVLRLIAHGGMGEVYEGRHVRLKRPVAVKLIRGFRQDDPVSHEHFLREMETAGQLEHPNLVRAYDAWEHDGYLFLAQELLDGDSLQTLAHKGQIKTPDEIVAALLGTCRALDQLHGKGFVHRDVKPANIMRLTDGTIKVIDYGLAVATDSGKSAGRVGAGTVGYMSPEQANGSGTVDNRSDIYSAGRVLKYLLSKLPEVFAEAKQAERVQKLTALAERLTQREPNDRLQSVYAVIVQLEQLQQPVVPTDTPPEAEAPPKVPPTPPAKRSQETKRATSRNRTAAPPPEPKTKPQRRGVGWLALFALILAAVLFTAYQIVFKTDRQTTVLVENHQPGDVIKITSEDGKVRSVELGDQPKFVVDRGTYELSLEGPDNRRLNPANITVTGRDQLTVRIEDTPEPIVETLPERGSQNTPVTSHPDQKTSQLRQPSLHMLAELVADSTASIAISSDGKTVYWDRNGFTWSATRNDLSAGSTFRNAQEWIGGRHLTLAGDVGVLLIKEPTRNFETLHQFTLTDGKPSEPKEISTLVPDSGRVYSPHLSSNGNVLCFAGRFNGSLPQLYFSKRSTNGMWSITQPLLRDSQLTDGWTWPWLSGDGKVLLTTNQGQSVLDDKSQYPHNIFVARRTSVNEPFTKAELIDLPGMKSLWFQAPRYLHETGELFVLVQPRSEAGTPTWKLAVIRGVRPGDLSSVLLSKNLTTNSQMSKEPSHDVQSSKEESHPLPLAAPFSTAEIRTTRQAWSNFLKLPEMITVGMSNNSAFQAEFVLIPPGTFELGMPATLSLMPGNKPEWADSSQPAHRVTITQPFYLSRYEVTQQQFGAVMGDGQTPVTGDGTEFPATQIAWKACVDFCNRLTQSGTNFPGGGKLRLLTEAEWEYACRAGTTSRFWSGDQIGPSQASLRISGREMKLESVGAFQPNPFGLYQMHGNVSEWCSDWFSPDSYASSGNVDPKGPADGSRKVIRGGGYSNPPFSATSYWRHSYEPGTRSGNIGLRPVLELPAR